MTVITIFITNPYVHVLFSSYVVYIPESSCNGKKPVTITDTGSGYLASYVTSQTGCGTMDTPWVLKAGKRRRINLTLFDFSQRSGSGVQSDGSCVVLVTIKEITGTGQAFRDTADTVCAGSGRQTHIFRKMAEEIQIRFVNRKRDGREIHFLLKYEGW